MFIDLVKAVDCRGRQPAIGQISKSGDKEIRTEGLAVFKGGKLVGWLDPFETRDTCLPGIKCKALLLMFLLMRARFH